MKASLRVGKPFGIPVLLHYTWFFIFALITYSLSSEYFPHYYPLWEEWLYWVVGVATSILIFTSLLAHELSHSLVSSFFRIPVRSITLFIFGGVARIEREAGRPKEEFLIAISGPVSSLFLGGLFWFIWQFLAPFNPPLGALAFWLFRINILLAFFNLLPGFPLDGGRVFRSLIWHFTNNYTLATRYALFFGRGVAFLFILGGLFSIFFRRDFFNGIWLMFLGLFLFHAVQISGRQIFLRDKLFGVKVGEIMSKEIPAVPSHLTLKELVENYVLPKGQEYFLIVEGERILGVITLEEIKATPQELWASTPVLKAMSPKLKTVSPKDDLITIYGMIEEEGISQIPVIEEGKVVGMITKEIVYRFIQARKELGV